MAQLETNSFQNSQTFGVVDVLLEWFSADKSVKHVERLIKGRRDSEGEITYNSLFDCVPGTNYVLRLTNVTKSSSRASYTLTNDGNSTIFKNPANANISGEILAGETHEHIVVIPSGTIFNVRLASAGFLDNTTPVVTAQANGANLNLLRNGNVYGSIPNSATFNAGTAGTYTNPYYIATAFDWDWQRAGNLDAEAKVTFTFTNAQTPVQMSTNGGTSYTTINTLGFFVGLPPNSTQVFKFKDATNVVITKTVTVGALAGTVPAAPTVAITTATTDNTFPVTFESGTFQIEILRGTDVISTVSAAVSPYNYKAPTVGSYTFRIRNANGASASSTAVTITQGTIISVPAQPVPAANTGTVGVAISGTSPSAGTLLIFIGTSQIATAPIVSSSWSYTPASAGQYTFKVSNSAGVSATSFAVAVTAASSNCNLQDGVPIADWTIASTPLAPRTFDGGLTFVLTQVSSGGVGHFRALGKDFLDRTDINFRTGYSAAAKSCFAYESSGGNRPVDFLTPAGYETYLVGDVTVFKPSTNRKLELKEEENSTSLAVEMAWNTTNEFATVPESRWVTPAGTPKIATFEDVPASGTIFGFMRGKANKNELANTQIT